MSAGPHLLLVEGRFYSDLSDELAAGALAAIEGVGGTAERVAVPGALEIPGAIRLALAARGANGHHRFDGFVALGCVIRGETTHYETVAGESARGLMTLTLEGVALGNGILTVENYDQAWVRAKRDDGDKGGDAARAALALIGLKRRFQAPGT